MNDTEGEILCSRCGSEMDKEKVSSNKTVQNMINKIKIRCPTLIYNQEKLKSESKDEVDGNIVITDVEANCDWSGMIKE